MVRNLAAATILALAASVSAAPSAAGPFTGFAGWTSEGVGACGKTSTDSQLVVGVSAHLFNAFPGYGGNPNENPLCGRPIIAAYKGKTVNAIVVDRIPGAAQHSLLFSPSAFDMLASRDLGSISGVVWRIL